jgi:hypothetical protein
MRTPRVIAAKATPRRIGVAPPVASNYKPFQKPPVSLMLPVTTMMELEAERK